ncbi:STS14 protein [Apostasia shenzhenica]|uniref:STS14 protein n=1 Tax=Apostasia shenzhenica TaxID=1088818 RepID=A0A2I0A280_9ASPA|nr:STS14 protein [Apostasia shenzhenica]
MMDRGSFVVPKLFLGLAAVAALLVLRADCASVGGHSSEGSVPSSMPAAPPQPGSSERFLTAHNQARAAVAVGPLCWNPKLASYAALLAAQQRRQPASCQLADLSLSPYGSNQAVANFLAPPAALVGSWVDGGRRYYNHRDNSCAARHGNQCAAYTQVVWRKTAEVGCGSANCGKDGALTICLYFPRGNVRGESPF